MAQFDKSDDSVVVVIGSGAGGGTLGTDLALKGVKTVILEAGGRHEIEDFINDEWGSFGQLAWLDPRTTSGSWRVARDFSGLPAWIVKAVGGSTVHWAGGRITFGRARWGEIPLDGPPIVVHSGSGDDLRARIRMLPAVEPAETMPRSIERTPDIRYSSAASACAGNCSCGMCGRMRLASRNTA